VTLDVGGGRERALPLGLAVDELQRADRLALGVCMGTTSIDLLR
jgi:hypothetical protein